MRVQLFASSKWPVETVIGWNLFCWWASNMTAWYSSNVQTELKLRVSRPVTLQVTELVSTQKAQSFPAYQILCISRRKLIRRTYRHLCRIH